MYRPTSLSEATRTIQRLRNTAHRYFIQMCVAKARVYDLNNIGKPEPTLVELKAENVRLKEELHRAVKERDDARTLSGEKKLPFNTEVMDGKHFTGQGSGSHTVRDFSID